MRTSCETFGRAHYPSPRALKVMDGFRKRLRIESQEDITSPRFKRVRQVTALQSYFSLYECELWWHYGGNLSTLLPEKTPARTDMPPIVDKPWWDGFSEARLLHDYQYPKAKEARKRKIVDRWVEQNVPDIFSGAWIVPEGFVEKEDKEREDKAMQEKLAGWVSQSLSKWRFPVWLGPVEKELFTCIQKLEDTLADDDSEMTQTFLQVRSSNSQRKVKQITATQLLKYSGHLYQTVFNLGTCLRVWAEQSRYTKEQREWIATNIDYYLANMGLDRDTLPDPKMIYRIDAVIPKDNVQRTLWEYRLKSLLCAARKSMLQLKHKQELQFACRHQVTAEGSLDEVIKTWNRLESHLPWTMDSVWGARGLLGKPFQYDLAVQFQLQQQMETQTQDQIKACLAEKLEKVRRQQWASEEDRYRIFLLNRELLNSQTTYEDVVKLWNSTMLPKHAWTVENLLKAGGPLAHPAEFRVALNKRHHPDKAFAKKEQEKAIGDAIGISLKVEDVDTTIPDLEEKREQLSNKLSMLKREQDESSVEIEQIRQYVRDLSYKA